ncbi:MAG: hypothetical protein IJU31_03960 [Synergistaceae bacterium]|nr:hypothetical protein [Synergistaceae bacterium]
MTLEEACDLLGVSPDENFDLEQLEKNYDARVAKLKPENLGRVHISML